ncbi:MULTISPECIES: DUF932 domain-containing protein [Paraburkholderia]|uniref:DUF945 domain-containing protein n=4 Tax=Paraburkholderia TaxID=1822464 RepID=B2JXY3_PARP8|nr:MULTISPECIES: DUF932 domain-containing protein [Paraburkholderia]ACC76491.1 protein of unknown function DUF932 [Paraburkholderia phymatum STM815]AFT90402.1 hypothetical protein BUPH_04915 [Paraburkholderia phenoliruptrix BR3459a]MCO4879345.1 DUF945 domain-containing protein [Paraburkholderia caribensis]PTB24010.1 DUF945 domain-containing protein [Paraburkholderia caribensis]CAB4051821.1 hypothetical protein LMG9964_05500 [Paraburkholderia phenoliruptrix]
MNTLASRFSRNAVALRSDRPLSNDEIAQVAPSILAQGAHESRSARYSYIPTIDVLDALRKEGFQPFMVCQTRVRNEGMRHYTKHMLRLRHGESDGHEANEIILLNSHNGQSVCQMLGGCFRFVCQNGMVCGDTIADIRVPHKGDVVSEVIEGAFRMLDRFEAAAEQREGMMASVLDEGEQTAFARAALALRYDEGKPAPVTERQLLAPRRVEDRAPDLWSTFSRVQENILRGGLHGRNANGRPTTTRAVTGIDQNIRLNRALWILADELRRLRG